MLDEDGLFGDGSRGTWCPKREPPHMDKGCLWKGSWVSHPTSTNAFSSSLVGQYHVVCEALSLYPPISPPVSMIWIKSARQRAMVLSNSIWCWKWAGTIKEAMEPSLSHCADTYTHTPMADVANQYLVQVVLTICRRWDRQGISLPQRKNLELLSKWDRRDRLTHHALCPEFHLLKNTPKPRP